MKKSVSVIVSLSVIFSALSMAGSVSAKTSVDFTDLKDLDTATKVKFDALISAGVFDGVAATTFGLKDKMNRAQFAKVAALIFKLPVNNAATTSTFSDVVVSDPANGYALPFIEAIVKAGITDGFAPGQYNPAGEVTKEQLATFLLRGLGLDTQAKATAAINDVTVSPWAKSYVALALSNKLLSTNADGTFGGTSPATRDLLVLSSYEASQQFNPVFSGKYGIASFKAGDSNVFTVQLNSALTDTAVAKLNVTRNGAAVTSGYTTTWNADKNTATLKFDSKFDAATWTVTLDGVTNLDEASKTAQFVTTVEQITAISFMATSDTLPNNKRIRIDFKAANQYGGQSSLSSNNFNIFTSKGTITPITGEQAFYLDLPDAVSKGEGLSLTVVHESTGISGNKLFTIGDKSLVSKLEIGDLVSSSGTKLESISSKGFAYVVVLAYDQYGVRVEDKALLNSGVVVITNDSDLEKGNVGDTTAFVDSVIGDTAADLMLRSVSDKTKDINISIIANGSGQAYTKVIKIAANQVASSLAFGAYNYSLSNGDMPSGDEVADAKFYVPILVKDSQGNQLTAQEIYDQRDKFIITATNGITLAADPISGSGSHKGMISIAKVNSKDNSIITIQLKETPDVRAQLTLSGNELRKADDIRFAVTPAKYMTANTSNELGIKLYDQFGAEMKYDPSNQYMIRYSLKAIAGDATSLAATSLASRQRVDPANVASARKYILKSVGLGQEMTMDFKLAQNTTDMTVDSVFDKTFNFYTEAGAKAANFTFKASLLKADPNGTIIVNGANFMEIDTLLTSLEVIDPNDSANKLTYEAYLDKSNSTLLAADDYFTAGSGSTGAAYVYDNFRSFAKEVKVRAKKDGSEEVKVPSSIVSISSSNTQVAEVASKSVDPNGAHFVAGGKAGTSKLSILFTNSKNEVIPAAIDVTVKNEGPIVSSMMLNKVGKDVTMVDLQAGLYLWDAKLAEKITVKDQYANEFVAEGAVGSLNEEGVLNENNLVKVGNAGFNNNEVLKISFFLTNVVGSNPSAVTIDAKTGLVKYTGAAGDVTSFKVNVVSPSSQTATFDVTVK
ncbi:S-layer homology domain-containing protein [Paenibacillus agricola]|uniref:S-layer homology domain-containing protein n=1 Tax=Paenibacillus agricola TaxID=2716264 RepID=A0ABX0JBY6_9BACL|nr:S-layer homology domain-containing protein [Paenibacillus agricola]NHN34027.1 S-layer homology domain-containing protein [Paenibacillus agricola]